MSRRTSVLRLSAALATAAVLVAAPAIARAADEPRPCASPAGAGMVGGSCGPATAAGRPGGDQRNLAGGPLATCSTSPMTGWFRDGRCATDEDDRGSHTVCAIVDDAFLSFSRSRGNDLVTPRDGFPGLRAGDRWCLCAARWEEARRAGVAPPVVVEATNAAAAGAADRASLLAAGVR
jgi:uncharacterized protein (DUF2237 family)